HLWMSLEALTKAKIRAEIGARKLSTEDELAASLQVEKSELDATIRRRFLLQGDDECYTLAKKASDGFEHGFLGFDRLLDLSQKIRVRMAGYVRSAILELATVETSTKSIILSESFSDPIGPWPLA